MTHLQNTYGLKAIPSEKILKEFRPARGMRFRGPITLTPEDEAIARTANANRYYDAKSWLGTRLVPDITPVFRLIAEQMGYDLPALLEGKGETGKPEDSWTVYADEGKLPMLIRWTIGDAQLQLVITAGSERIWMPELTVLLLANRKALPHLNRLGEALRQIEVDILPPKERDVPDGNVLQRVLGLNDSGDSFSIICTMHVDPTQPLSVIRAADLAELQNSATIIIEEAGVKRGFGSGLLVGEMKIQNRKIRASFHYDTSQGISREFLEFLRTWSVEDIEKDMEEAFASHFAEQRHLKEGTTPDSLIHPDTPEIDVELAERKTRLMFTAQELTEETEAKIPRSRGRMAGLALAAFRGHMATLGEDFTQCPPSVLRGTGPGLKMKGGDVMASMDLLDRLLLALCSLPEKYRPRRERKGSVKLTGVMEAPIIAEQYRDNSPTQTKFTEITNPFHASHRGLPVRVDRSVMVWRQGYDTEALAADFFYAPETRDLHVANLYRVKVPKG